MNCALNPAADSDFTNFLPHLLRTGGTVTTNSGLPSRDASEGARATLRISRNCSPARSSKPFSMMASYGQGCTAMVTRIMESHHSAVANADIAPPRDNIFAYAVRAVSHRL